MPELPEVETVRRGLEAVMPGRRIARAEARRFDLRFPLDPAFDTLMTGRTIERLERRGKYIAAFLSGSKVAVLHLGMAGRVSILPPEAAYSPQKHDHVTLTLEGGARVIFNDPRRFGYILLGEAQGWMERPPFRGMGPEPLGRDFCGAALAARLQGRKTSIKAALLDQRIVAGIGNIYACEALFAAGIDPARPAGTLREAEAATLAAAIRSVLERAIAAGGSSLRDHRQTDGSLGYFQHMFSVYGRTGLPCPGCACDLSSTGGIRRIVQGGRSSFYCSTRQK